MTYLTVPISAKDLNTCKEQIKTALAAGAEALELRTDYIEELNIDKLEKLMAAASKTVLPIVVTCRDAREGGQNNLSAAVRMEILAEAVKLGADFIDCEYENFKHSDFADVIKKTLNTHSRAKLILSAHNFKNPFDNLAQIYEQIFTLCPAAIAKTAYHARHINDCFAAFDALKTYGSKAIAICMGDSGTCSRITAKKLNACMTFASIEDTAATAPGQLTVEQMQSYRFDIINSETEFFGVIADPVRHSISPAVHNACFAAEKKNRVYLPLLVCGGQNDFNSFIDNIISRPYLGFKGFSITIPHKISAMEYAREKGEYIEPLAVKIGAVNTFSIGVNERISAFNTDYTGAMDALSNAMGITRKQLHGRTAAIIGAGGAARAIIAGLSDVGAKVIIYNRTISKANELAMEFGCRSEGLDGLKNLDAEIIINCTSIGMHPEINASPVPAECLKPSMIVFDTVYNPIQTLLLKQAEQAGAKTVSGAEMFIGQAVEQFKLFTHSDCPTEILRKAVFGNLGRK